MNRDIVYCISVIKESLTMPQILRFYGFNLKGNNRMPCPFHDGNDNNFSVSDMFYHCFVCGAGGDIINFVKKYFELDTIQAVAKLNDDFSLGLPVGKTISLRERRAIDRKKAELQQMHQKRENLRNNALKTWDDTFNEFVINERKIDTLKPQKGDTEVNQEYLRALAEHERLKFELRQCEEELDKWK